MPSAHHSKQLSNICSPVHCNGSKRSNCFSSVDLTDRNAETYTRPISDSSVLNKIKFEASRLFAFNLYAMEKC